MASFFCCVRIDHSLAAGGQSPQHTQRRADVTILLSSLSDCLQYPSVSRITLADAVYPDARCGDFAAALERKRKTKTRIAESWSSGAVLQCSRCYVTRTMMVKNLPAQLYDTRRRRAAALVRPPSALHSSPPSPPRPNPKRSPPNPTRACRGAKRR